MTSRLAPISAVSRLFKKVATKNVACLMRCVFHALWTISTPTKLNLKREVFDVFYFKWRSIRRKHFSKKFLVISFVGVSLLLYAYWLWLLSQDYEYRRLTAEKNLEEALKEDKGTGCEIPKLDPFSPESKLFDVKVPKILCPGNDWVRCYFSKCKIDPKLIEIVGDRIECTYRDIMYLTDSSYYLAIPTTLKGNKEYMFNKSDHVKIFCRLLTNVKHSYITSRTWIGHGVGYRPMKLPKPPVGKENGLNVLIIGFDSTSRNGFTRRMPESFKFITEELGAVVLNAYNIVGDGTSAAIFPLLSGTSKLEHPYIQYGRSRNLDPKATIFQKVKKLGYHTAYFEDSPGCGTYQQVMHGFRQQVADHYLRAFFSEHEIVFKGSFTGFCVGDTPRFKLMLNLTDQFFKFFKGKLFDFTFIADITHEDFNYITNADQPLVDLLKRMQKYGRFEDTLIIIMGDHGPRYTNYRRTLQGRIEERLPIMAIYLPEKFKSLRPEAWKNLKSNANTLTTPHDVHATILDVLDMREHWNKYKVPGADLTRALSLLQVIPKNRSCSEAGIEPHWCTCLRWEPVKPEEPIYQQTAQALLDHINQITAFQRKKCALRTLTSTDWVTKKKVNSKVLEYVGTDLIYKYFKHTTEITKELYQIKITVGPGVGEYEAVVTHLVKENRFLVNTREISRVNAYKNEPACISDEYPHLKKYCYCIE